MDNHGVNPTAKHYVELTTNPHHRHASKDVHQPMPNSQLLHGEAKTSAIQEEEDMISRHRTASAFDAESQSPTRSSSDPLELSRRLKSRTELDRITANTARKRNAICNPLVMTGHAPGSKLAEFYE